MTADVGRAGLLGDITRLIARHPVASFFAMVIGTNVVVAIPPSLTRRDLLPFEQAPYDWLSHVFGCAAAAFVVTAASEGRDGVRDLARRCFRWRVPGRWYVLALLGVPVTTLLLATVFFGLQPIKSSGNEWPLILTAVLPHLLLVIVLSNFAEEIGWTGYLFVRLQRRHRPLRASALVTLVFAAAHVMR